MATDEKQWQALADRLASLSIANGDPTGWFEHLYGAGEAGEVPLPWERTGPHPRLAEWAARAAARPTVDRAVVIGCGLGADAEFVAGLGFETIGFDISETAIRLARLRHPDSAVSYRVDDLLDPSPDLISQFDLVVEIFTVQALPDPPRRLAITNAGRLVKPGGTLFCIEVRRDDSAADVEIDGPPWPLLRREIEAFATDGLDIADIAETNDPGWSDAPLWLAEFRRPT